MAQVTKYFSRRELQCRCGCGSCAVDPRLLKLATHVRELLGAPMYVNSCYRCEAHNRRVGGAPLSRHKLGLAMDFYVRGVTPKALFLKLKDWREKGRLPELYGLGLYDWGVHIDADSGRKRLVTWDFRKKV